MRVIGAYALASTPGVAGLVPAVEGLDEQGNNDALFTTRTCLPASDAMTTIFLFYQTRA
jgi:hypothetical protein